MSRLIIFFIIGIVLLSCNHQKKEIAYSELNNESEKSHKNLRKNNLHNDLSDSKLNEAKVEKVTDNLTKKNTQEIPPAAIIAPYESTKDMSEDAGRYKHLLRAPDFIKIDSLKRYSVKLKDTVLLRNLSFKVTGIFWTNNELTANGRSNNFHGSIEVRTVTGDIVPYLNIGYVPYLKYVESYYFFGDRVYVRSKGDWEDHQFRPPDTAVYEYLNTLTNEKVYVKGSNFKDGGYIE